MKPFTLEWWLLMHYKAVCREQEYDSYNIENYKRFSALEIWISERIINKYGE